MEKLSQKIFSFPFMFTALLLRFSQSFSALLSVPGLCIFFFFPSEVFCVAAWQDTHGSDTSDSVLDCKTVSLTRRLYVGPSCSGVKTMKKQQLISPAFHFCQVKR